VTPVSDDDATAAFYSALAEDDPAELYDNAPCGYLSTLPDGTDVMVINGAAMPPGTRLSIGYFAGHVRLLLIKDGAPLSCGSTSRQPAVHITPAGTPIRG